ncbi:pseudouridine synthase [Blattabacterium cuenoti]|uniref:pseudouridine synthase n=1 Tax=Blattabacterium cuenoti TaxID=1653831 RepID=UPI00163C4289|nr:pseudouridine synthase [Blattabacterium cuenoti]
MKKIRLNHYISLSGISSRRKADKLIKLGLVEVNGKIITKLGTVINNNDLVKLNGEKIQIEEKVYLLINKPKGFVTTTKDQLNRKTVMSLIPNHLKKYKLFPVGRLDRNTTGMLLITNDGTITEKLTHPKYHVQKIYCVLLNKQISSDELEKIRKGEIYLKEGRVKVNFIRVKRNKKKIEIGLCVGWNRIVKRIFKKLNYKVIHLDRINFGGFTKKFIKRGIWMQVSHKKIKEILEKNFLYEKKNNYN